MVNGHTNDDIELFFPDELQLIAEEEKSVPISELFQPQWRWITIRLWAIWAGFAFGYYGTIITTTRVFEHDNKINETLLLTNDTISDNLLFNTLSGLSGVDNEYNDTYHHNLQQNTNEYDEISVLSDSNSYDFDFKAIFISSSAELVGSTFIILFVDRFGRVPIQIMAYLLAGVCVSSLCLLASMGYSRSILIVLGFLARVFEMTATCVTWTATAEILSTDIRSTGKWKLSSYKYRAMTLDKYLTFHDDFLIQCFICRSQCCKRGGSYWCFLQVSILQLSNTKIIKVRKYLCC